VGDEGTRFRQRLEDTPRVRFAPDALRCGAHDHTHIWVHPTAAQNPGGDFQILETPVGARPEEDLAYLHVPSLHFCRRVDIGGIVGAGDQRRQAIQVDAVVSDVTAAGVR
jgi:hypothetical protein